jgi:hypothetical protein
MRGIQPYLFLAQKVLADSNKKQSNTFINFFCIVKKSMIIVVWFSNKRCLTCKQALFEHQRSLVCSANKASLKSGEIVLAQKT